MKRPKGAEVLYKYRIGDYRVIMSLFDNELVVLVVDIGPRRTIYKKYGGKGQSRSPDREYLLNLLISFKSRVLKMKGI